MDGVMLLIDFWNAMWLIWPRGLRTFLLIYFLGKKMYTFSLTYDGVMLLFALAQRIVHFPLNIFHGQENVHIFSNRWLVCWNAMRLIGPRGLRTFLLKYVMAKKMYTFSLTNGWCNVICPEDCTLSSYNI